jgi:hypothetical protein
MVVVFFRHKVKDYEAWKAVFDNADDFRKAGGEKSYRIFHAINDPSDIGMMFERESLESAKKFSQSPELKAAMIETGVCSEPFFDFVQESSAARRSFPELSSKP